MLIFAQNSNATKAKKLAYVHSAGYVYVRINGKYRPAHRVLYERFMNRPISKKEVVHHKNSKRADNRMENLELVSRSKHTKLHWQAKKAEIHKHQLVLFQAESLKQESLFVA